METSESIKNLATALCEFQAVCPKIKKTKTNPFFHSKYADYADIVETIRIPLHENGLSYSHFPIGKYELETIVMHISGEWMRARFEMKPAKDDPQGAGSVITYQKRYALGAVFGLDIDDDDDGNIASGNTATSTKKVENTAVKTQAKPEAKEDEATGKKLLKVAIDLETADTRPKIDKIFDSYPELKENYTFRNLCNNAVKKLKPIPQ